MSTTQKLFSTRKSAKSSKNVCILLSSTLQLTISTTVKEKYGSDFDEDDGEGEDDSESDESEDEDGQELTPNVDAAILRTLARIKRKDPAIYNTDKNIFVGVYGRLDLNLITTHSFITLEEEAKSGSATKRAAPPKDKVRD